MNAKSFTKNARKLIEKYPIYVVLIALILIMTSFSPVFLTGTNLLNMVVSQVGRGILALGAGLVIITGGIDISVAAIAAFSSVVATSLVQNADYAQRMFSSGFGPIVPLLAVAAGLLCGLLMGIFNGVVIAYFKVPPFIATLGGSTIATGAALTYTNASTVAMLTPQFKALGQTMVGPISILIIYFIILIIICWVLLNKTRFGKRLYAVGGNVNAATVAGINVKKTLFMVYVISGLIASFVGVVLAARSGAGNCSMAGGYELDAIAGAIVGGVSTKGGKGTIAGIVGGVLTLGVLNNGFLVMGVSAYLQLIIKGFIIVGAVAFDMYRNSRRH